ncbi:MAG TPA: autotransporter outer membrane beta-barrel domain-containing protein, partial [Xanthobacteraceae bacterium]
MRVNSVGAADSLAADTANLDGKLRAALQPGLYGSSTTYLGVVVANNPITSQFAQVQAVAEGTTTPLAFFTATATYNANSVDLTVNRTPFGAVAGETLNQQRVGNAFDAAYAANLTGNTAAFYANLLQATSTGALDRLSGEGTSGAQNTAFFASNAFTTLMANQTMAWRGGERAGMPESGAPLGYAAAPPDAFATVLKAPPASAPSWHAWGGGFGGAQTLKGEDPLGSADFSGRLAGGALGLDYQANPDLLVGLAIGGSHSSFSVPDRMTSGAADALQIGAYAMRQWGSAYLMGLAGYGHFSNSTTRTITGVGPTETATGAFGSDLWGGRLELGNTWAFAKVQVTPFAAVQLSELRQAGYGETSTTSGGAPGLLDLTYQPINVMSLPTFLGVQLDSRFVLANGMAWAPYARTSWVHEFKPTRQINAFLNTVPGTAFTVDGARAASDAAKLDLGAQLLLSRNVAFVTSFNGEFSGRGQTYAGTGALKVRW